MENGYSKEHLTLASRLKLEPDDPLVFITLENQKLGKQVDNFQQTLGTWTTAILNQSELAAQQNRLIVEQNTTLQETAKNYGELSTIISLFSKETSGFARGLTQLNSTTNSLEKTSKNLLKPEIEKTNSAIQALSFQMSKIETGALVTSNRSQEILNRSKDVLERSQDIRRKLNELIQTWNVSWLGMGLFSALVVTGLGVGFFLGYRNGVEEGKWQIAHYWFDGFSNLDYWKQMRNGNRERVKQCIEEGRSECTLNLP